MNFSPAILHQVPYGTVAGTVTNAGKKSSPFTGVFRLPLRIGTYQFTAELAGFATVTRSGIDMQINQRAVLNLQLAPSTVQETVQVTGEAPLLDLTSSTVSGNIDQRQVKDLPVNGRNWLDLAIIQVSCRYRCSSPFNHCAVRQRLWAAYGALQNTVTCSIHGVVGRR